jgi:type II secretory pathway pseudopilin PulG
MWSLLAPLRRQEPGFSYLMVMIAITLIGIAMTVAVRQWKTMVQRELEADLLAKGIEIQTALALYSASAKAGRVVPGEVYPQTLAELTKPPKPFLRKVYLDPVGRGEWELLRSPTGGIMGVRSKSKHKPIKQGNFPLAVRHFEGKPTHYDWVFQYPNPSMTALIAPGTLIRPILGQYGASNQPAIPGAPNIQSKPAASEEVDSLGNVNDPVDSLPPENATPPLKPSEILDSPMDASP